ncbi:hypothetical protein I302_105514 [Kwoniella bestiolae CBS 10118]|uniref:Enoyl reductase (ER) domain-containing protein n=1 Tax=Kwoniella bestiolae CBS 10118 TaxID=1296100 RepID=A0A1B9FTB6_9TREE|nr:hypothetical protein I302_08795 [Kwoniella bestiolae CBS 10118]OCF22014.1 hypothetical protein I302_08795 [Kwoniella bestiolae CBS 10118]
MTSTIPQTMKAIVEDQQANWVTLKNDIPVPSPGDNEVLIKVEYAAQNPGDWKLAAWISLDGALHGCDFVGTVVKLGSNLRTSLELEDRIAGMILGGARKDRGAFAEYLVIESDLAFKVPKELRLEEAPTFGAAWLTAAQVIIHNQDHSLSSPVDRSKWYIVYGGSSSVGLFALQIAKALGYKVLTFASPHSFDLVRSYGADQVINYRDANAIDQALEITSGGAEYAFDTISEGGSFNIALKSLGLKGKQLNVLNPLPEGFAETKGSAEVQNTVVYTLLGKELNLALRTPETPSIIPFIQGEYDFGTELYKKTPEWIVRYGFKANPIDVRDGLELVSQGLKEQMEGKVSGKKLVYKIA